MDMFKKIGIVGFVLILLIGCKSSKIGGQEKNSFIPYVLPLKIERMVYEELKLIPNDKKIGVYFDYQKDGAIDVWLDTYSKGYDASAKLSNRKIFINDTFYPLVFDSDEIYQAKLVGNSIMVTKACHYKDRSKKETFTEIPLPSLSEREKMFPYSDDSECQLTSKVKNSMRHKGYVLTISSDGKPFEKEVRPDRLKKTN